MVSAFFSKHHIRIIHTTRQRCPRSRKWCTFTPSKIWDFHPKNRARLFSKPITLRPQSSSENRSPPATIINPSNCKPTNFQWTLPRSDTRCQTRRFVPLRAKRIPRALHIHLEIHIDTQIGWNYTDLTVAFCLNGTHGGRQSRIEWSSVE